MKATREALTDRFTEGNDGQTITKHVETYPPTGVYRVSGGEVHMPENADIKVANIHFDIDECLSHPGFVQTGRELRTAFWGNSQDVINRTKGQLSYALTGKPTSAQVTMVDIVEQCFDMAEAGAWIVDREIKAGNTPGVEFIRDRFYTPARWDAQQAKLARDASTDVSPQELADALGDTA